MIKTGNCKRCNIDFHFESQYKKFCSENCRHRYYLEVINPKNIDRTFFKKCYSCHKEFLGSKNSVHCSKECQQIPKRERYKLEYIAIKKDLIAKAGGACQICKKTFELSGFCFHHLRDKKFTLDSNNLLKKAQSEIEEEFNKCQLLCHNCHATLHAQERESLNNKITKNAQYKKNKSKIIKKRLVDLKGGKCEICGWESDVLATYSFNHLSDKIFELNRSQLSCKSWDSILKELDKCRLECLNCHISKNVNKNHERQV